MTPGRSPPEKTIEIQTAPGALSIVVILVSILRHGFRIVAGFTQRLPVLLIPEELRITSMGNDVVNNCCWHSLSLALAANTQRVGGKKQFPCPLPSAVVAFFLGGLGIVCVERCVFLTVPCAIRDKPAAAWVLAWCVGSVRHGLFLPGKARLTEVAVSTDLVVIYIQKPQCCNNPSRC